MIDVQRKALAASITSWREKVVLHDRGLSYETGMDSCACCQAFYKEEEPEPCYGCPIYEYTNQNYCRGTPYEAVTEKGLHPRNMLKWLQKLSGGGSPRIYSEQSRDPREISFAD